MGCNGESRLFLKLFLTFLFTSVSISACGDIDASVEINAIETDEASNNIALRTFESTGPYGVEVDQIDKVVGDEFSRQDIQGLAVAVIKDGHIIYEKGFGYDAVLGGNIPVTRETNFRWASISKSLTAVAAMQLAQSRVIDFNIDEDIRCYLPESSWPQFFSNFHTGDNYCSKHSDFAASEVRITTRQLLNHTSGIGHYNHIMNEYGYQNQNQIHAGYNARDIFRPDAAVALFEDAQLKYQPGEQFHYSTFGYILAAAVLEHVLKDIHPSWTYSEFVRQFIVSPLNMNSLRPDYTEFDPSDSRCTKYIARIRGYYLKPYIDGYSCGQDLRVQGTSDVSWKLPGGGWISNIGDLARFAQELLSLNAGVLSPTSRAQMWTRHLNGYGLG